MSVPLSESRRSLAFFTVGITPGLGMVFVRCKNVKMQCGQLQGVVFRSHLKPVSDLQCGQKGLDESEKLRTSWHATALSKRETLGGVIQCHSNRVG